jgi:hypothetical protein
MKKCPLKFHLPEKDQGREAACAWYIQGKVRDVDLPARGLLGAG